MDESLMESNLTSKVPTCGDAGGAGPLVVTFDVRLLSISDSSISSGAVQADPFFFPSKALRPRNRHSLFGKTSPRVTSRPSPSFPSPQGYVPSVPEFPTAPPQATTHFADGPRPKSPDRPQTSRTRPARPARAAWWQSLSPASGPLR